MFVWTIGDMFLIFLILMLIFGLIFLSNRVKRTKTIPPPSTPKKDHPPS